MAVAHRLETEHARASWASGVGQRVLHRALHVLPKPMLGRAESLGVRRGWLRPGLFMRLLPEAIHGRRTEAVRELLCVQRVRELCAITNNINVDDRRSKHSSQVLGTHRAEILEGRRSRRGERDRLVGRRVTKAWGEGRKKLIPGRLAE